MANVVPVSVWGRAAGCAITAAGIVFSLILDFPNFAAALLSWPGRLSAMHPWSGRYPRYRNFRQKDAKIRHNAERFGVLCVRPAGARWRGVHWSDWNAWLEKRQ